MSTTAPVSTDFHQWAFDTAVAIKERRFDDIDWERVAEEIHSLGISEESQLQSRLAQLMYYLLKIEHQPERRGASWDRTVKVQRRQIQRLLGKQPSLKTCLSDAEFLESAYGDALAESGRENLPDSVVEQFPEECPYPLAMLLPTLKGVVP